MFLELVARLCVDHRVKLPGAGHSFERVLTAVLERNAGSDDEILDRARGQYDARRGNRRDPCADDNCEPSRLAIDDLAFTGVHTGPRFESKFGNCRR